MFKPKRNKLASKLTEELNKNNPTIENLLKIFDSFENNDAIIIEKLKREKKIEMGRIHGALKQTINAHGPITKQFLSSASKRIYGALLTNPNDKKESFNKISIRDLLIGLVIGVITILLIVLL